MNQTKHARIARNGKGGNYIAILTQRVNWKDGTYNEQVIEMKHYQTRKGAEKKLKQWKQPDIKKTVTMSDGRTINFV